DESLLFVACWGSAAAPSVGLVTRFGRRRRSWLHRAHAMVMHHAAHSHVTHHQATVESTPENRLGWRPVIIAGAPTSIHDPVGPRPQPPSHCPASAPLCMAGGAASPSFFG